MICTSQNIILDTEPNGYLVTLYKADNRPLRFDERFLDSRRMFVGGISRIGQLERWSWQGNFQCSVADFRKVEALHRKLQASINNGVSPYGDTVLYNFVEPFEEGGLTTRTRQIVPSQDNPNPHLLAQDDNGDGTFEWSYYIVQQGGFTYEIQSKGSDRVQFRFDWIESTIKAAL